jgi:hypothetical protein
LIGVVLNDPLSALTREPLPNLAHLLQPLFLFRVFGLIRQLTAVIGVLFVLTCFKGMSPYSL